MSASKKSRPRSLSGVTHKIVTGCGDLFVTINEDTNGPFEIFIRFGKGGGCSSTIGESIGRLVSLVLRTGGGVPEVIKQLSGITCMRQTIAIGENPAVLSCADGVAIIMRDHLNETKLVSK